MHGVRVTHTGPRVSISGAWQGEIHNMHEMAVTEELVDIIREEMERYEGCHLRSVLIRIGMLSCVVPEALSFSFEIITSETELEGVRLDIEIDPLKGLCRDCRMEFEISGYEFVCPSCKGRDIEILSGQGVYLAQMDIDEVR